MKSKQRIALVVLVILIIWIVFIVFLVKSDNNKAQTDAKPMLSAFTKLGGKQICSSGDGGHGWDDQAPWFQTYYSFNQTGNLASQVQRIAQQAGFSLKVDTKTTSQMDIPGYRNSDYLISNSTGKVLTVRVAKDGDTVGLLCSTSRIKYGTLQTISTNQQIVDLRLTE